MLNFLLKGVNFFKTPFMLAIRLLFSYKYFKFPDYSGESILLVCNGPSLKKVDFDKLIKIRSFGLNKIHLLYDRTRWRPEKIFIINGLVLNQLKQRIRKYPQKYIVDEKFQMMCNSKSALIHINNKPIEHNVFKKQVSLSASVSVFALQIILKLKPKEVFIIGLDHSFKLPKSKSSNKIEMYDGPDQNHFSENYFKNQLWGVPDLDKERLQFQTIELLSKELGIKIYDCTIDGKLNVFEKLDINNLYSKLE